MELPNTYFNIHTKNALCILDSAKENNTCNIFWRLNICQKLPQFDMCRKDITRPRLVYVFSPSDSLVPRSCLVDSRLFLRRFGVDGRLLRWSALRISDDRGFNIQVCTFRRNILSPTSGYICDFWHLVVSCVSSLAFLRKSICTMNISCLWREVCFLWRDLLHRQDIQCAQE